MRHVKTLVFTPRAAKEFDALPMPAQAAIDEGLSRYAFEGRGDVKRLQGLDGYRLRIGPNRAIFDEDRTTILTLTIGRRQTHMYG
jgi:mRNA interferase RelE/StbE